MRSGSGLGALGLGWQHYEGVRELALLARAPGQRQRRPAACSCERPLPLQQPPLTPILALPPSPRFPPPGEEAYAEVGPLLPRESEEEDIFSDEELAARKY